MKIYYRSFLSVYFSSDKPIIEQLRTALSYDYATSGLDYSEGTLHNAGGTLELLGTD
ncbi:hypothetical protein [Alkalibacterium subtropicum]|uniref:hypothetical protein n=1 Tax=Alkalibacterium subtropicum TaxID=753702 RepID=UPI0015A50C2F|nr:hypothetical protein [Alkalibacterium subtropicum]